MLLANETSFILSDPTVADRLLKKVFKTSCGCWCWLGANTGDYGQIGVGGRKGRPILTHRVMATLNGLNIDNKVVMHTCDVGSCVNPEHLVVGTQQENLDDMTKKGRRAKGTSMSKILTDADVVKIRELSLTNSNPQIAKMFGVSHQTIWRITTGRRYN